MVVVTGASAMNPRPPGKSRGECAGPHYTWRPEARKGNAGDAGVAPCKVGMEPTPVSPLGPPRPLRRPGCSRRATLPPDSVEVWDDRFYKAGARRPAGAGVHCPIRLP